MATGNNLVAILHIRVHEWKQFLRVNLQDDDRHLVSVEDLEDKELVSDAAFRLVLAAYAVKFGGIEMIKKQEERK